MRWTVIRNEDDSAVITAVVTRKEADEILNQSTVWENSPQSCKEMFTALRLAADERGQNIFTTNGSF